jgi:exodeoxyribonuclease VII large subunit
MHPTDLFDANESTPLVYTVSQLNQEARLVLEGSFPPIWVEGEISNIARPSSGHLYFSLKDATAQIRCAMFQMRNRALNFRPDNGMQVLVRGKVSLYEGRGDFQLLIDHMEEAGDGALRRAFELLKQKLAAEGLFDLARKRSLPSLPRCIGVITSPTGAAIRDIISVLKRRFESIPVIIYPTAVQGNAAAAQIVEALSTANQRQECDVLIVTRGGGSLEDLWPFNEEIVARAIFISNIPVISGVGHEIDFTISDFVADHRAPTPSAAAELVSPDRHKWQQDFNIIQQRLTQLIISTLQHFKQSLSSLAKRLRHPGERLREQSQHIDLLEQRLLLAMQHLLHRKQALLTELARALDAISPLATLQRGYAIVTMQDTGEVIYNSDQVKIDDRIRARLGDGSVICRVETKE